MIINDDSYKKLMGITISEQMCVALNMLPFFLSFFLLFFLFVFVFVLFCFVFFFGGGGGGGGGGCSRLSLIVLIVWLQHATSQSGCLVNINILYVVIMSCTRYWK